MIKENLFQELLNAALQNKSVAKAIAYGHSIYGRLMSAVDTVDEFGMDPVLVDMLRPVFQFLYSNWWRVEVKGVKNIPARGPAIIVANHSGMLPYDAVMINMAIFEKHARHRNVRFLVDDFVDNFPFLSLFIQRAGGVKASPENASKLVKNGELICVFPEGTRGVGKLYRDRYKLEDFGKGGVARLARETGAPVIPCAVVGAEEIHPILWKFEDFGKKMGLPFFPVTPTFPLFGLFGLIPFPSRWSISFGKPIHFKSSKKSNLKLTTELKETVQKMVNEELIRHS